MLGMCSLSNAISISALYHFWIPFRSYMDLSQLLMKDFKPTWGLGVDVMGVRWFSAVVVFFWEISLIIRHKYQEKHLLHPWHFYAHPIFLEICCWPTQARPIGDQIIISSTVWIFGGISNCLIVTESDVNVILVSVGGEHGFRISHLLQPVWRRSGGVREVL